MTDQELPPDLLKRIVALARRQAELEAKIAAHDEAGKKLARDLREITGGHGVEGLLPIAMAEAQAINLTLDGGVEVEIAEDLQVPSVGQRGKHRDKILAWLDQNGHGDVIKRALAVPLSRDSQLAERVREVLAAIGAQFKESREVNAQTLGALFRELLEAGEELPMDELGLFMLKRSKVKVPK